MLQQFDGGSMSATQREVLERNQRVVDGALEIAPRLEVQRQFRGQLGRRRRAKRFHSLRQTPMKLLFFVHRQSLVKKLPMQCMSEVKTFGDRSVGEVARTRRPDELMPGGKFLTQRLDLARVPAQHSAYRPGGEALAGHAAAFEDALFGSAERMKLHFQHLV